VVADIEIDVAILVAHICGADSRTVLAGGGPAADRRDDQRGSGSQLRSKVYSNA